MCREFYCQKERESNFFYDKWRNYRITVHVIHKLNQLFKLKLIKWSLAIRVNVAVWLYIHFREQVMLTLTNDVNYEELTSVIESEVGVPRDRQRIRIGFPPKELKPPVPGEEGKPIPLKHGDKIMLEAISVRSASVDETQAQVKVDQRVHGNFYCCIYCRHGYSCMSF